jgi:hypothetical protein
MDRSQIKRDYKQKLTPMGVYQIRNLVNGKVFLGSSKNLPGKINGQRFQLEAGSHMNKELQRDFDRYGKKEFAFEVLDYLEPGKEHLYDYTDDLEALENLWREKLMQSGRELY